MTGVATEDFYVDRNKTSAAETAFAAGDDSGYFCCVLVGVNVWTHLPDFFDHAVANVILMASTFFAVSDAVGLAGIF